MNRRPPVLKLSKALTGFLHYKAVEGLSPAHSNVTSNI
jgi:hypothetical protein